MTHKCRACGCEGETPTATADAALPAGWFVRNIDEVEYVLCDVCGHIRHFRGGVSPYLTDALELDEGARCDVSAEIAVLREQRRSFRRERGGEK
jgi:hypothetical protein